ncbi:pantothenate synthetase [Brevibacterium sanguinis]|uniref:Pantothenate synthetase n=2 Tax=Brevibacterium TaxID=1696 RepID=A0A366IPU5_9MICO|nr:MULTISPECIES: pantoate--beta-alanine ligase [Brevibacterium]RBP68202.1 pantothenate synthetase [Brevibacterium sanguinis]RBP74381.1 pantothenate synthetase [Brevibacterium celere]
MEVGGIEALRAWRAAQTGTVALVPTMGALHSGHQALMARARESADAVVTSIFVNPLQFGADEDFVRYPRPFDADLATCDQAGVDFVFAPALGEMYPSAPEVRVSAGRMGEVFEGASRPGHFDGVLTVVAKLFALTAPHRAVFGLKDIQQFFLVKRMIADLNLAVELIGLPVVRDADGLAMSSRNEYLDAADRRVALAIPRALRAAADAAGEGRRPEAIEAGTAAPRAVEAAARAVLEEAESAGGLELDYLALVVAETFRPCPPDFSGSALLLVSATVSGTRLIDNCALELGLRG